jgi:outer membrane protein TolC
LAIGKQVPEIRLGPELEDDRGDLSIGIGLGITLPLFDRNQGGIAVAEEARHRAREHYRATLLAAAHAAAGARDELAAAEQWLQFHREGALRHADEAARTLENRLRTGRPDIVELLTGQRAIARARARELELEERAAVARLRAAVAGGLALEPPAAAKEVEVDK